MNKFLFLSLALTGFASILAQDASEDQTSNIGQVSTAGQMNTVGTAPIAPRRGPLFVSPRYSQSNYYQEPLSQGDEEVQSSTGSSTSSTSQGSGQSQVIRKNPYLGYMPRQPRHPRRVRPYGWVPSQTTATNTTPLTTATPSTGTNTLSITDQSSSSSDTTAATSDGSSSSDGASSGS